MLSLFKHRLAPDCLLPMLLLVGLLVYLPGISAPFLFDDAHNILSNEMVRMDPFELTQLLDAAHSAGQRFPNRGLARLTFGLNDYLAGGAYDASAFKLTTIIIHLLNTVLLFMLAKALFLRCIDVRNVLKILTLCARTRAFCSQIDGNCLTVPEPERKHAKCVDQVTEPYPNVNLARCLHKFITYRFITYRFAGCFSEQDVNWSLARRDTRARF